MESEWKETTLEETAYLKNGKGLNTSLYDDNGNYPVWGANGQIARTDQLLNEQPVVVIGRVGAYCGSIHAVFEPSWVTDNAIVATPLEGNDFRFVYYLLKYLRPERTSIGSAQPLVTQAGLKILKHLKPPLSEQKIIAHILGTLDDKIELNRQMNATLEAMAQAIFKSWFVDFDPVIDKALAAGNPIPPELQEKSARRKTLGNCRKPLPPGISRLFPDSFVDSELGIIPNGWRFKRIGEICNVGRGASPRPIQQYMDGDIPWIKIADATSSNGPYLMQTKEKLKREGVDKSVKVLPGDLILSNSATCGLPIFVDIEGCIHDGWLYFKSLKIISKYYLFYHLKMISDELIRIANGSVQKNLNTTLISNQKIVIPQEKPLSYFNELVGSLFELILSNVRETKTLASTRDTLLPKLLSGQIRMEDNHE